MLGRDVADRIAASGADYPLTPLAERMRSSHVTVVSFDGAIVDNAAKVLKRSNPSAALAPPNAVQTLLGAGTEQPDEFMPGRVTLLDARIDGESGDCCQAAGNAQRDDEDALLGLVSSDASDEVVAALAESAHEHVPFASAREVHRAIACEHEIEQPDLIGHFSRDNLIGIRSQHERSPLLLLRREKTQ